MKSRPPVAPGRHKEVYLAVKPRVMCLHLNEKARKERERERERETEGGREIQAELRGQGPCQAETLEECSSSALSSP